MNILKLAIFDWAFSLVCGFVLSWASFAFGKTESTKLMPLVAIPLAGFTVAAFNLRFRIIDSIQKIDLDSAEQKGFRRLFNKCRKRIRLSIFAFVFTTLMMACGTFYPKLPDLLAQIFVGLAWGAFTFSLLKFVRILKTFEALEDFTLDRLHPSGSAER